MSPRRGLPQTSTKGIDARPPGSLRVRDAIATAASASPAAAVAVTAAVAGGDPATRRENVASQPEAEGGDLKLVPRGWGCHDGVLGAQDGRHGNGVIPIARARRDGIGGARSGRDDRSEGSGSGGSGAAVALGHGESPCGDQAPSKGQDFPS